MCVLDKSPCDNLGKQLKGNFRKVFENFHNEKLLFQLHSPKLYQGTAKIAPNSKHRTPKS